MTETVEDVLLSHEVGKTKAGAPLYKQVWRDTGKVMTTTEPQIVFQDGATYRFLRPKQSADGKYLNYIQSKIGDKWAPPEFELVKAATPESAKAAQASTGDRGAEITRCAAVKSAMDLIAAQEGAPGAEGRAHEITPEALKTRLTAYAQVIEDAMLRK